MMPFDDRDDRIRFIQDTFILLTLAILTLIGVLWLPHLGWQNDGDHSHGQFSTGLLTAVIQSSLVGALVYCLVRTYFEDDEV